MTRVVIPDSITQMGANPFAGCANLSSVQVSPDHPCLSVVDGALISRPDARLVLYPAALRSERYEIPQGVKIIGDRAFYDCDTLTAVEIPKSVTSIGGEAFYHCSALKDIVIPFGVERIGTRAFFCCNALKHVEIPDSVSYIGSDAFE